MYQALDNVNNTSIASNIFSIEIIAKSKWKQKFCEISSLIIIKMLQGFWLEARASEETWWLILKVHWLYPTNIIFLHYTILAILMIIMGYATYRRQLCNNFIPTVSVHFPYGLVLKPSSSYS